MDFENPPADPVAQIKQWIEDARAAGLPNPNAMALATVSGGPQPAPSARIVLLKDIDARGAVFYTNKASRKGRELAANAHVALLFHWDALDRQVRIEGSVAEVSDVESDAYFATRPRESRIGAWASQQSQPVANRSALEQAVAATIKRFEDHDVPRPPHWGGYRVSLESVEFWQGHQFRLHDRIVYTAHGRGGWSTQRLFP